MKSKPLETELSQGHCDHHSCKLCDPMCSKHFRFGVQLYQLYQIVMRARRLHMAWELSEGYLNVTLEPIEWDESS